MNLIRLPERLLVAAVRFYRFALSPWLGSSCRFEPSCSTYALVALERHGALRGTVFTAGRILRCHPWCEGGRDDVPAAGRGLFTGLLSPHSSADHPIP